MGNNWGELDHLRREVTTQADEIRRLRLELSKERHARLTAEMRLAAARNDEQAWAEAMQERELTEAEQVGQPGYAFGGAR